MRHYERQRRNPKNSEIASLHFVSAAMTNLGCVSPVNIGMAVTGAFFL